MAPRQRTVHVSLRNVAPMIPEGEAECAMLKQDFEGMGCVGLLQRAWNIKNEDFVEDFVYEFVMIREKQAERSNIF